MLSSHQFDGTASLLPSTSLTTRPVLSSTPPATRNLRFLTETWRSDPEPVLKLTSARHRAPCLITVTQITPIRTGEADLTAVHRAPSAGEDTATGAAGPVTAAAAGVAPSPQAAIAAMAAITKFLRMARSPHDGGLAARSARYGASWPRAEGTKCAALCDRLPGR
jgi:hypothetical protein